MVVSSWPSGSTTPLEIGEAGAISQFMNACSEMARDANKPSIAPVWHRELLMARDPLRITYNHREYPDTKEDTITSSYDNNNNMVHRSFFFGPTKIAAIRRFVPHHLLRQCSTFDVITACFWRCRTKALQMDPEEEVRIICIITHVPSSIPRYAAVTTVGKLCGNPFGYAVELINKLKSEVTEDYMHSVADLMVIKERCSFTRLRSCIISDLTRARFREVDFGWGDAVYGGVAQAGAGHFPATT